MNIKNCTFCSMPNCKSRNLTDKNDCPLDISDSKEPVSEKDKLRGLSDGKQHLGWLDDANALEEPINKELDRFIKEYGPMATLEKCAAHFAEWGKKHSNLSVSDDLDKAAKEWLIPQLDKSYELYGERMMMELTHFDGYAMLDAIEFGTDWQKQQMIKNATEVTVRVDAGNYPYISQIELYDYDKDIPLAKEGDRYKVVLIKED